MVPHTEVTTLVVMGVALLQQQPAAMDDGLRVGMCCRYVSIMFTVHTTHNSTFHDKLNQHKLHNSLTVVLLAH